MPETTTEPYRPTIAEALSGVMDSVGAVSKSGVNQQQGFNFRGVDAVVNAVSPALREHGVIVVPKLLSVERSTTPTRNGGTVNNVYVTVRYRFIGPAGDHVDAVVAAESFDSGDKATTKAMSVAFRIALLQTLALPTDEPTDPDQHTFERAGATAEPPRAARPQQSPGAQRRAAQAPPPAAVPIPDALADQYRDRIINAVISWPVGADRDSELRGIRDQLATIPGAGETTVPVPEPWQQGRGTHAPLGQLVIVARNAGDPTDPTA